MQQEINIKGTRYLAFTIEIAGKVQLHKLGGVKMSNGKQYEKPGMEIIILENTDVITTSELTNGGTGTGDSGGLPSEIDLENF